MTLTYNGYYLQGRPDEIFEFLELDDEKENKEPTENEAEDD